MSDATRFGGLEKKIKAELDNLVPSLAKLALELLGSLGMTMRLTPVQLSQPKKCRCRKPRRLLPNSLMTEA